jgi:D-alanyl-D-alanine carboxypeptidase
MPILVLKSGVGKAQSNLPEDIKLVRDKLVEIDLLESTAPDDKSPELLAAIGEFQAVYMTAPDFVCSPGGTMARLLGEWAIKPVNSGVQLPGRLQIAWDLVNPLLPPGSSCTSGFRSADDQRRILHKFYQVDFRAAIIAKYGQKEYDEVGRALLTSEAKVLAMVRGVGQQIAAPGASKHQQGKAIDVGGPSTIDDTQVSRIRMIARANPTLLSGVVLKERNGCVHFEIV